MLIDAGMITEEVLAQALTDQKKIGIKLGELLIQQGIIDEDHIIDAISKQLKIEKFDANKYPFDDSLTSLMPPETARKFKAVPLMKRGHLLTIAMTDPMDINALDAIEVVTNMEVEPVVCSEREFNQLISSLYGRQSGLLEALGKIEDVQLDVERDDDELTRAEDLQVSAVQDMAEEPPVVSLVNTIMAQAVREGASDVHISPEGQNVHLRFRIDGKLHDVPAPPKTMILPIISRIKVLANMDISISRVPQDGRFTIKMENKEINVRASSVPTIYGENLVMRLLDMSIGVSTLDRLGMSEMDSQKVASIVRKPHGMILSTGPTGSGKSTSLYSILKEINKPDINIITLEDPVEYRIDSIRQVQLNRKAGMTFASGLKSILRQDPDVIMVGEIRDAETAGIATQAALTGHRVLTTLHTNDAAGAVTRLLDMGIEPFLVSSVLLMSFAQRLVRKVCPNCKEPYRPPEQALAAWGLDVQGNENFQRGRGCHQCMNTGYRGRMGIFEVLIVDEVIQEMIIKGSSAQEISRSAVERGKLTTLREDAAMKVAQGITTLEEALSTVMS
ncbi:MAG: Flp pilus assembly complex ATPase component TadA [Syntrophaceae bacterium]|nr:Flp pilus assembly complex ATPase component TadA [Syntrophaceae bacterium]